jgi:DNA-binding transcriptional ArsR family regulator
MTTDRLQRSPNQALYRYMPEQPYSWATPRYRGGAMGANPNATTDLDVAEEWLKPALSRLIEPFALNGLPSSAAIRDLIDKEQYRLVTPLDLRATRFPNTFHCPQCDYFRRVDTSRTPGSCPKCQIGLEQFSWVYAHTCGEIAEITAPVNPCPRGHRGAWRLTDWQQRGSRWVWRCMTCRAADPRSVATMWCRSCGRGQMTLRRSNSQDLHYAQQITVLNPPTRAEHASLVSEHLPKAAVAQVLGLLEPGKDGLRQAGLIADSDGEDLIQQLAARLGLPADDPMLVPLVAKAHGAKDTSAPWLAQVDALGLAGERLEQVGEECLQLALALDSHPLDLGGLKATEPAERHPEIDRVASQLRKPYGITTVTLLRKLPVASVVAGYTRMGKHAMAETKRGPQPVGFRFFPTLKETRIPMYGVRTETEGLVFQLDPLLIVQWLARNGLVAGPGPATAGEAQQWMLQTLEPVTDIFEPPADQVTRAVLTLVHSASHRMMKSLSVRCGLNIDSLAEHLSPLTGAFLIYANKRSQFTLGGLEYVFRHDLADALTELTAETRCLFDPVCRDRETACTACLFVSEIGCARFNSALSRKVLFGGQASLVPAAAATFGGRAWTGFWRP